MGWCSHCQDDVPFLRGGNGFICCSPCGKIIDQDVNFAEDNTHQDVDNPGVVIQADPVGTEYSEESGAYEDIDFGDICDGDEYEDYSDGEGYEDCSDVDFDFS